MARMRQVIMPNGKAITFYKGDDQTWQEIVEQKILPLWMEYCNSNWISVNHEALYAPEKRVKSFLDRCAQLIIYDNSEGLETEYMAKVRSAMEIPMTECPPSVGDTMYSAHVTDSNPEEVRYEKICERLDSKLPKNRKLKPHPKKDTKFNRLRRVKKKRPDATYTWCPVNAENDFLFEGVQYHIPFGVSGYTDSIQAMDRILVVNDTSGRDLYDQNVFPMMI